MTDASPPTADPEAADPPPADPQPAAATAAASRDLDVELNEPDGPDVPLTDHAPALNQTGPEQRGTGGSG